MRAAQPSHRQLHLLGAMLRRRRVEEVATGGHLDESLHQPVGAEQYLAPQPVSKVAV